MVALLAAMRRVPIEPPGGSAPALGELSNPHYNVTISDREAADARAQHAAEAETSRLFPNAGVSPFASMDESVSTAFERPAQTMIAGITGRKNGSINEGMRSSSESLRRSQDSRRHVPGPYFVSSR